MRLAPLWPVWVVPALALMRLLAGRNVGAASPDSVPELAIWVSTCCFHFLGIDGHRCQLSINGALSHHLGW